MLTHLPSLTPSRSNPPTLIIDGVAYHLSPVVPVELEETTPATRIPDNSFRRMGHIWKLRFDSKELLLRDALGLRYIHHLMTLGGEPAECTRMIIDVKGEASRCVPSKELDEADMDSLASSGIINDQVLPPDARRRIIHELSTLREEANAYRASGESERALEIEEKLEEIQTYLNRNTYRGRSACFTSPAERDRKSVGNAMRRAIRNVDMAHPFLGNHLLRSIEMGFTCRYLPSSPTIWSL